MALAFCIGVLACRLWVFSPAPGNTAPQPDGSLAALWRLFGIGIALMAAGSIIELAMRTAEMSGRPMAASLPVLPIVLSKTHYGHVWLVRVSALFLLLVGWGIDRRFRGSRAFPAFMLCMGVVFAFCRSASGHASDAGDFSIPEIMDWVHLVAASVWGGGLFALSAVILPRLVTPDARHKTALADVARRFSRIAGLSVGAVVVTAIYNAWISMGSLDHLWNTPYGLTASAKISLLLLLLSLGAFNRYISVPLLQQWADRHPGPMGLTGHIANRISSFFRQSRDGRATAFRFKRSVMLEALLIAATLFSAALLQHEIPARHLSHFQHQGRHQGGGGAPHAGHEHPHH